MIRRPPRSTLFPTRRSSDLRVRRWRARRARSRGLPGGERLGLRRRAPRATRGRDGGRRSEEHTSELQSQSNLVCRLLLEKKKKKKSSISITNEDLQATPSSP